MKSYKTKHVLSVCDMLQTLENSSELLQEKLFEVPVWIHEVSLISTGVMIEYQVIENNCEFNSDFEYKKINIKLAKKLANLAIEREAALMVGDL